MTCSRLLKTGCNNVVLLILAISQLHENRKASMECLEGQRKVAENLKVKIRARNYKRCLITSK